ncbi:3-hydroxyacyl-CoA dehydrogenase [Lacibacterium aquatile]|uniref:3-hydroxyacyl-CoA dehydrogenase n=1 Tax=Lacibacterium aquatile TaxID=1168082 RepID=A0ABW5DMC6_9PROT
MPALPLQTSVAVIGAGTMGIGIAQVAAQAGHEVRIFDARAGAADDGVEKLAALLRGLAAKGRIPDAEGVIARLRPAPHIADLAGCGLAIEAIVEDLSVKRSLFDELAGVLGPEAILATNTSSLSIAAIAARVPEPGRFAGLHFFNPAPLMPLVEVISGPASDPATVETLMATAEAWGKQPIRVRAAPGFAVNRCARPYYGEAWRLLSENACSPATLDAVMREAGGFRLGPAELMDMIGHDIGLAVSTALHEAFGHDPRYAPSWRQRELVEAGFLGRKSGRGLYPAGETPAPANLEGPVPVSVTLRGEAGLLAPLVERIGRVLPLERTEGPGVLRIAGATLALTDGRLACERAKAEGLPDLVLLDLARDFGQVTRLALCGVTPAAEAAAAGLLEALGIVATPVADTPGLILGRTLAQLIAEACLAEEAGVASVADIDRALRLGLGYPLGPFEWAQTLGWPFVAQMLGNLQAATGEDRYRTPVSLRRRAI